MTLDPLLDLVPGSQGRVRIFKVQPDQINMAVLFWYHVKTDLASVFTPVHWTSRFLQDARKTRGCLTGHPVRKDVIKEIVL